MIGEGRAPRRTLRTPPRRHCPDRPQQRAQHVRRYLAQHVARTFDSAFTFGMEVGGAGKVPASQFIQRYLGGDADLDLMTGKQLEQLAIALTAAAGECIRKSMRVPVEPYLLEPGSTEAEWQERLTYEEWPELDEEGE